MASESDLVGAASIAVGGTGITTLVFLAIRHIVLKISRDATTVAADSSQREQIASLREEIARLEELVKKQSAMIEEMNRQVMRLRFAFIDEQAALLRILNEMNSIDDPHVKARIGAEIAAANQRRLAVLNSAD